MSIFRKMKLGVMVSVLSVLPLAAQEGPEPGCYARTYSAVHLAQHPAQVVRSIWLMVQDQDYGSGPQRYAYIVVDFANQGHVAASGRGAQRLDQSLQCFQMSDGQRGCAVDCDGGSFVVTHADGQAITIATEWLGMGDTEECGGPVDLAEVPGQQVKYRLMRVPMDECLAQVRN